MPVREMVNPTDAANAPVPVLLELITDGGDTEWLELAEGDLTLGTASRCDLRLTGGPALHSVVHRKGNNVWIEATDAASRLEINSRPVRRLSLRDGDRMVISGSELFVHIGESALLAARRREAQIDAANMTAEELCDRIAAEEMAIQQFEGRRRLGLQALLAALGDASGNEPDSSEAELAEARRFEELLEQIKVLSNALDNRTQILADRESELLETSSQLQSVQDRMTRQLDELMLRLNQQNGAPDELRASA
ncbi:FHA domain-containing protein [Planctellipticum variicoloris]|uniref:FHA domain-containing protein n=1 Tax=Planctellipticum variicoloris TaxID=3064265 RepID=UPI003013736B|nr:hypothetical protein SH412_002078 [Planctomycetaceae bacterium SH412]